MKDEKAALILPFSAISARDLPRVGGKGANLGEMTQAGLPVPPGYCVTTDAFSLFMQASGRADAIYERLDALTPNDVEAVRRVGQEVRASLRQVAVPAEVEAAVVAAWQALGDEGRYAVRSSATAEDLPDASFAGQQDTYLNVSGQGPLLEAVRDCWISLFTDRAILYRAQNQFSQRDVQLAVVVQRQILPEVAGILFTADPVSGHRQIISIDASYGLGEALVAGLVSPDLYKVDKRSRRIVEVHIGDKQLAIRPKAGGGTVQEPLEGAARTARVLDDRQVLALADVGMRIERHYGKPQDIEWCSAQGEIYIVQARPITSLFPLPQPAPPDQTLHLYFSFGHAQMMTDPMPPLVLSFWRSVLPFGKPEHARLADNPYLTTAAGRLYVDLTPLLRMPRLGKQVPKLLTIADSLGAGVLGKVIECPDFTIDGAEGHAEPATLARWLLPVVAGVLARLWWLPPEGATARLSARIEVHTNSARAQLRAAAPGLPRLQIARRLSVSIFPDYVMAMPQYVGAGILARTLLIRIARGLPNPAQRRADVEAVGRGISGNVTTEMDLLVGDLADAARLSPALVRHLSEGDAKQAIATANMLPGSEAFLHGWASFMEKYGMRGPGEIDISRPGWGEEPASLVQMVLANVQHSVPGAHRAKHAQLAVEGRAAAARLVEAARHGPRGGLRGWAVERLTRVAIALLPTREHPKYMFVQLRRLVREVVLECGAMLVRQGRLTEVDDVWYLAWNELEDAMRAPNRELRLLIHQRRQDQRRFWAMAPPRVITSDGEIPAVAHEGGDLPAGALAGSAASAGVVEGKAKVILDPRHELLAPGEILIAPYTDPGWTPLFINAAGLVTEVGGLMTHGSVVAREYGIPAVVAVIDATKKIHTGQKVRVNGDAGYVEVLEEG